MSESEFRLVGCSLTRRTRVVLHDVSFSVAPGEIVGLLGPNGAGKTSLLRCLSGVLRPDQGTVWLDGREVAPSDPTLRAATGVVFQDASLDPKLTVQENLRLAAQLYRVPRREAAERIDDLLRFMELSDRASDRAEKLSGGMRRKLELARALIHGPQMLLLDEPTTGLDPAAYERTWQRLLALRRSQGLSVVVSTHRADEAARCDRVVVMDRGKVVADDAPEALLSQMSGDVVMVEGRDLAAIGARIESEFGLVARQGPGCVVVEIAGGHAWIPRLVEAFEPGALQAVRLQRPTLADVFFKLTGQVFGEDGAVDDVSVSAQAGQSESSPQPSGGQPAAAMASVGAAGAAAEGVSSTAASGTDEPGADDGTDDGAVAESGRLAA